MSARLSSSCPSTCTSSPSASPTRSPCKGAKDRERNSNSCNSSNNCKSASSTIATTTTSRSISSCSSSGSSGIGSDCLSSPSTPECGILTALPSASPYLITPINIISSPPSYPAAIQPAALKPLFLVPGSWKQHYGMEAVWIREFSQLFSNFYPHIWAIQPVACNPTGGNHLICFVDSAKVRFCCDVCGHGWTSMKGRVAFWFDLMMSYGIVAFKLYGQVCDRCKDQRYESPMWYPEEVQKVLINLYNRVGQAYYGFYAPVIEKNRRAGKPRTPHNSDLCQACQDGVCSDRK